MFWTCDWMCFDTDQESPGDKRKQYNSVSLQINAQNNKGKAVWTVSQYMESMKTDVKNKKKMNMTNTG